MIKFFLKTGGVFLAIAMLGLMAGCGSSGGSGAATTSSTVEGVATPSSIAVVSST